jgi:hypothetical protein
MGSPRAAGVRATDLLLPAALATWLVALHGVHSPALNDWGLLSALPVAFYLALALLAMSSVVVLFSPAPSRLRLALHLVALVVMLHGTVPLIFPETNFPWAYKHMGVAGNINLRGGANSTIDIYQNWPGFFAAAAWFDHIAGVSSPLSYAKWAPVYFNLLLCLELAFILRHLRLSSRQRWLALFISVGGNWVGQDYFAPQALALVLSLAVYGMMLAWFQADRPPAVLRWVARMARRIVGARADATSPPGVAATGDAGRLAGADRIFGLALVFAVFSVVVVTHQLSPYLVFVGLALAAAAGFVRPRWIVAGLTAVTIAYLVPHLAFLHRSQNLAGSPLNPRDVLNALSNPLDNLRSGGFGGNPRPGRAITSKGAPLLIVGLWALAGCGALRRFRARRPMLLMVLLAGSPLLLAFGQNYGGEAIFRIYLFSLPWVSALAACALVGEGVRWPRVRSVATGVVLAGVLTLFLAAFYGSVELYRVRPGSVAASEYFYAHAPPGSVLGLGAPNFPGRVAANYDEFQTGSVPPTLTTLPAFVGHQLGPGDVSALNAVYQAHAAATSGSVYLCLGADQDEYAHALGFFPEDSLAHLDRALAVSPRWQVVYRNRDAVIYRFVPSGGGAP